MSFIEIFALLIFLFPLAFSPGPGNMSTAQACLQAIKSLKTKKLEVTSLQDI